MRVSVLLKTHHLQEEVMPWMAEAGRIFDKLVIFIDEKRATPGTLNYARKLSSHVHSYNSETWYASDFAAMARACESDWVFLLDYDEELSPEWQQDGWREILETTHFTHFWLPRRHIVPGRRYINCDPWWPDFQLRLFRNNLEGTVFPTKLHDSTIVPGPSAHFQNLAVHHHVLWLLSRAEREEKRRLYMQLLPDEGRSYFQLYEDYSPPTALIPEPSSLDVDKEIGWMNRLLLEDILKVSLQVVAVPKTVQVSQLFWFEAEITSAVNKPISALPPYPVRLAYHWIERATRKMVVFEGSRSNLFPPLDANATRRYPMTIVAPNEPGDYILQTTLVQDGSCWFENVRPEILQEFAISARLSA